MDPDVIVDTSSAFTGASTWFANRDACVAELHIAFLKYKSEARYTLRTVASYTKDNMLNS